MPPSRAASPGSDGTDLAALRRPGRATELLFLYEITVHRRSRLRPIAQALGLSVQAASLVQRSLTARGFVETVDGAYHPTVRGIEALHGALSGLRGDLDRRLGKLQVVRTTRALAEGRVSQGDRVSLELFEGTLRARVGSGGESRGRALHDAGPDEIVEVGDLEGILRLTPAPVLCLVVPSRGAPTTAARRRVAQEVHRLRRGLLAAEGVEALQLLRRSDPTAPQRFGVAAAAREASQMGVPVLVIVSEERLPSFLQRVAEPSPLPQLRVDTLESR